MKAADDVAGASTKVAFKEGATRHSPTQIEASISAETATKNLTDSGCSGKSFEAQNAGTGTVMSSGDKTYQIYPNATSTGGDSASVKINGEEVSKIRFKDDP